MGRAKGTPKTGGRKKGTPNKATATLKEWLISLLDNNRKQVEQDLQALEPKERLHYLFKLIEYAMPKQAAVQAKIDFDSLSDEQLDTVINKLTGGIDDDKL